MTTARYFIDADGHYLGCYAGVDAPAGAIEVPNAPKSASQIWDFSASAWLSQELTQDDYTKAIQDILNQAAIERRYTSGDTMATYVSSTNATWAAEAAAFVAWRDAVWLYAYTQLAAVQAGERTQPTVDELLAELPTANWPA